VDVVERRLSGGDVEALVGGAAPGDLRQPVEVGPGHVELGAVLLEGLELGELVLDGGARLPGDDPVREPRLGLGLGLLVDGALGGVDARPELAEQGLLVVRLHAQLLLDGLHLLVEEERPLLVAELGLDLPRDLRLEARQLALRAHQVQGLPEPRHDVALLEARLELRAARGRERSREVGQFERIPDVHALREVGHVLAVQRVQLHELAHRRDDLVREGLDEVARRRAGGVPRPLAAPPAAPEALARLRVRRRAEAFRVLPRLPRPVRHGQGRRRAGGRQGLGVDAAVDED